MLKLSIMTEEELAHIFGDLDAYIPLHEGKLPLTILCQLLLMSLLFLTVCVFLCADLLMKLTEGTGPDGTVAEIGQIVIDWVCTVAY